MRVSLIAAVARNGVIGRNNNLPWRLRDDSLFFRKTTLGHHVLTGRRNYEAMGKPLPGRPNIVISRSERFEALCPVVTTVEAGLQIAREAGETEAFIIGGAEIYRLALPLADAYYRTRVLADVEGDIVFPPVDESQWKSSVLCRQEADERNEYAFVIEELTRLNPN